jgi:hypothetical protein
MNVNEQRIEYSDISVGVLILHAVYKTDCFANQP